MQTREHQIFLTFHSSITAKKAAMHAQNGTKVHLELESDKITAKYLMGSDKSTSSNTGGDEALLKLLAELEEHIIDRKEKGLPYSIGIEANYGFSQQDKWIISKLLEVMDKQKYYPAYFITTGNGNIGEGRAEQIALAIKHAEAHHYYFRTSQSPRSVKAKPRRLSKDQESKDQYQSDSEFEPPTPTTPNTTSTSSYPPYPDSSALSSEVGANLSRMTISEAGEEGEAKKPTPSQPAARSSSSSTPRATPAGGVTDQLPTFFPKTPKATNQDAASSAGNKKQETPPAPPTGRRPSGGSGGGT